MEIKSSVGGRPIGMRLRRSGIDRADKTKKKQEIQKTT
jgi:hypothetical protein